MVILVEEILHIPITLSFNINVFVLSIPLSIVIPYLWYHIVSCMHPLPGERSCPRASCQGITHTESALRDRPLSRTA